MDIANNLLDNLLLLISKAKTSMCNISSSSTTTVNFYYCRQTTKRIYKNIIINKQYIQ